ncbi:MAG: GntR family transcriptional regulator, transcriptional repressor for pyruvate dehydrogenase complex [Gammaproteobacteria bacterium]|nr:GntR family transcriptional regulator, transcriptional repressor for pyruvate dehydrogenase complex [Gammaproteobacteria bacterium]
MADMFAPLDDQPAYRQIANLIEARIVGRSLRTGDPLPSEADLARQFGVNRSTIREAIRELESQGLLGRGRGEKRLRVTRPEPRSISSGVSRALALHDVTYLELWEAMMAIEPAAAQYAAARRTAVQLQALTEVSARFARELEDTDAAVAAVVDFFTSVAQASGNQVLALSQAPLNALLAPTLTQLIDRVPQARTRIKEAQSRITSAIKLKRSEQARTWMEKHIRDFKRGYELGFPL